MIQYVSTSCCAHHSVLLFVTIQHYYNIIDYMSYAVLSIPVTCSETGSLCLPLPFTHFASPPPPTPASIGLWTFWTHSWSRFFQRNSSKVRWFGSPGGKCVAGHLGSWIWKLRKGLPFQHVATLKCHCTLWNSCPSITKFLPNNAACFWNSSSSLMEILPYYTLYL